MIFVAADDSTTAAKDAANYVCDGTDDQVQINAAISDLGGNPGTVLLFEGNYNLAKMSMSANKCIELPHSGIILAGEGYGTALRLEDSQNVNMIRSDGDALHHIFVRDMRLDGNRANNPNNNSFETCGIKIASTGSTKCQDIWVERVYVEECRSLCVMIWGEDTHVRNSEFGCASADIVELLHGSGEISDCIARVKSTCGFVFGSDFADGITIRNNTTHVYATGEVTETVHRLWQGQYENQVVGNTILLDAGATVNRAIHCQGYRNLVAGNMIIGRGGIYSRPKIVVNGGTTIINNYLTFCDIEIADTSGGWPVTIAGNGGESVTHPAANSTNVTVTANRFI